MRTCNPQRDRHPPALRYQREASSLMIERNVFGGNCSTTSEPHYLAISEVIDYLALAGRDDHNATVRHTRQEAAETLAHCLQRPPVVEVVGLDIGHHGDVGSQQQEGAVALIGFGDR
jgi:hypothetical protein